MSHFARQRGPAAYVEPELPDRIERTMGPRASVLALRRATV